MSSGYVRDGRCITVFSDGRNTDNAKTERISLMSSEIYSLEVCGDLTAGESK